MTTEAFREEKTKQYLTECNYSINIIYKVILCSLVNIRCEYSGCAIGRIARYAKLIDNLLNPLIETFAPDP